MTFDIPADMLLLFVMRMDEQMIDSMLSDKETYMNMKRKEFLEFISRRFSYHKLSCGDTALLALRGTYQGGTMEGYSFLGNKSRQRLDLIVAVNEKNEIIHLTSSPDFAFHSVGFAKYFLPENTKS